MAIFLCGAAQSLDVLVARRTVQGATGAPLGRSRKRTCSTPARADPAVVCMFGMAVGVAPVVGPVLGPVLAGDLAEAYSWRWAFHMLVPAGHPGYLGLRL